MLQGLDHCEQLFPGHVVPLFASFQGLAGISNDALLLYVGHDGPGADVPAVGVEVSLTP